MDFAKMIVICVFVLAFVALFAFLIYTAYKWN